MTLLILQRKPTPSRISLYLPMLPVRSHSFSDLVPMEPRSDLPPMTPEHPQYKYLECVSQLFQLQPIWDKRYLTLEVQHRFPDDDPSVVQSAVAPVLEATAVEGEGRRRSSAAYSVRSGVESPQPLSCVGVASGVEARR